jgi:hypothetical protein
MTESPLQGGNLGLNKIMEFEVPSGTPYIP